MTVFFLGQWNVGILFIIVLVNTPQLAAVPLQYFLPFMGRAREGWCSLKLIPLSLLRGISLEQRF